MVKFEAQVSGGYIKKPPTKNGRRVPSNGATWQAECFQQEDGEDDNSKQEVDSDDESNQEVDLGNGNEDQDENAGIDEGDDVVILITMLMSLCVRWWRWRTNKLHSGSD